MKAEKKDNIYYFTPIGELSLRTENDIKNEIINELQKDPDFGSVSIILKQITFIDSSGIGMLMYVNKYLNSIGKTVNLVSPTKKVSEILMLGAFDKLFKIEK